jgi:predicted nucleotide-binding protein (sugar kinase/HSP70/actin superfamily)
MKIGILRSLLYYPLGAFWNTFFDELGFEVVVSPVLQREKFDQINHRFVGDICLPVTSVTGHVESIIDSVDLIFIPKLTDRFRDLYICPVCAGLPMIVKQTVPHAPPILNIFLTPIKSPGRQDLGKLGEYGCTAKAVKNAYRSALAYYDRQVVEWKSSRPPRVKQQMGHEGCGGFSPRVLLLGMPYVLADPLTNLGIPKILQQHGCDIVTPLQLVPESAYAKVSVKDYPIYWSFAGLSLSALARALQEDRPDGVIYLSAFACGVDSTVAPLVQSVCRRCEDIPYLMLTVDEHSMNTHIEVRVEALLECIRSRMQQEQRAHDKRNLVHGS